MEREFGVVVPGKRVGVFVAVTASAQIYAEYEGPSMSPEQRAAWCPMVLMVQRWDGALGFIGGFVGDDDPGESLLDAAARELHEEVAIGAERGSLAPLCAHEAETIVVHLCRLDLGRVATSSLRRVLADAAHAQHAIAEGCAVWAHLADYGRGKGLPRLLAANTLATAVREELEVLLRASEGG